MRSWKALELLSPERPPRLYWRQDDVVRSGRLHRQRRYARSITGFRTRTRKLRRATPPDIGRGVCADRDWVYIRRTPEADGCTLRVRIRRRCVQERDYSRDAIIDVEEDQGLDRMNNPLR